MIINRMKKRINLIVSVLLILCLALSGCSKSEKPEEIPSAPTGATTSAPEIIATSDITDAVTSAPSYSATDSATTAVPEGSGKTDATEGLTDYEPPVYIPSPDSLPETSEEMTFATDEAKESPETFADFSAIGEIREYSTASLDAADIDFASSEALTILPIEPVIPEKPQDISAGLLSAGEWKDNVNYDFIKNLLINGQDADYQQYFLDWKLTPFNRIRVCCYTGAADSVGPSVENAVVKLYDSEGTLIFTGRSDNEGMVYVYYALANTQAVPKTIEASFAGETLTHEIAGGELVDDMLVSFGFAADCIKAPALDLMFVVDTTGSMGDEIYYLQAELSDVIKRVKEANGDLPIRLSMNFYRDHEDDYVVRSNAFDTDIETQLSYLNKEYAFGGGDYEEAVEEALDDAINNHAWNEDSVKLLFIVLDAPPHNTPEIQNKLASVIASASEKGIRIIPVASSGVDKNTEFLLRTFAMTTGGTYTFLTGNSGIGGSHIEPTIGSYTVEYLNDLLVRVIDSYIGIIDEVKPYLTPVFVEPVIIDDDITFIDEPVDYNAPIDVDIVE